jgi:hypothetical protein
MSDVAKTNKPLEPPESIGHKLVKAELAHVRKLARAALLKYGHHANNCPCNVDYNARCSCSFYDTLANFK